MIVNGHKESRKNERLERVDEKFWIAKRSENISFNIVVPKMIWNESKHTSWLYTIHASYTEHNFEGTMSISHTFFLFLPLWLMCECEFVCNFSLLLACEKFLWYLRTVVAKIGFVVPFCQLLFIENVNARNYGNGKKKKKKLFNILQQRLPDNVSSWNNNCFVSECAFYCCRADSDCMIVWLIFDTKNKSQCCCRNAAQ